MVGVLIETALKLINLIVDAARGKPHAEVVKAYNEAMAQGQASLDALPAKFEQNDETANKLVDELFPTDDK